MTRAEEIKHAAHINEDKANIDSYNAFIRGAKWADEHPNSNGKELLYVAQNTADRTKKEIISKACEWLKLNTNWDDEWDEMGRNIDYGMIKEFRKAMEE
jgi:hypothetical protein